jgi:glutathione S-transferase
MSATHADDRQRADQQPPLLELWQTEWCPASQGVRQRLTELVLSFLAHPVPVDPDARTQLQAETRQRSIPVPTADAEAISGEDAIRDYLDSRFPEPADAHSQCEKTAGVKRKELEC